MTLITQIFHSSILFWAAWVIIPIVMEIIPTICNFFILIKKKLVSRKEKAINFSPEILQPAHVQMSDGQLYLLLNFSFLVTFWYFYNPKVQVPS